MAEQSLEPKRKWLHVNQPTTKERISFLLNFQMWAQKPLSSPFRNTRKVGKVVENEVNKWQRVNEVTEISYTDTLPFSKSKVLIKSLNGGSFSIEARKPFESRRIKMFESFGQLTLIVDKIRKNSDDEKIEFAYNPMDFFTSSTRLAHLFSQHFSANTLEDLLKPGSKKKDIDFSIDRDYINFLLSLETMHPFKVAKEMLPFIAEFTNRVYLFAQTVAEMQDDVQQPFQQDLMVICERVLALRNALIEISRLPETEYKRDGTFKVTENKQLPTKELCDFLYAMENNVGTIISKNIPMIHNALIKLSYNDSNISKGSEQFELLENFMYELLHNSFSMSTTISRVNNRIEVRDSILESSSILLHRIINKTELKETFKLLAGRCKHLVKTLESKNSPASDEVETIYDEISRANGYLETLIGQETVSHLMTALRTNPLVLSSTIENLEVVHNAKNLWEIQIDALDRRLNSDENDRLILNLEKYGIDSAFVHDMIQESIRRSENSMREHGEVHRDLNRAIKNPVTKGHASNSLTELEKHKTTLITQYKTRKTKLFKDLFELRKKDGESSGRQLFEKFCVQLDGILSEFEKTLEEIHSDMTVVHSGPNAALLIGLGQGGEQIVRAAMAKMMNSLTDTRSKNLLTGLNVNISELKEAIDDGSYAKTVVGIEDENLTSIFDSANLLAINAGPEQALMLKAPYNYIWGNQNSPSSRNQQKKDNYLMPSTNCVLLDVGKKGCGGKMGKGRAFAVNAENAIQQAIIKKRGNQKMSQVCIVHSFAGGSGSGMILPVLRMVKRELPNAVIWVFSAGDTEHGKATHAAENVVYITSDVLQSHYNALHHEPKTLYLKDWKKFEKKAKGLYEDLNSKWGKILKCLPDNANMENEFKEHRDDSLKTLEGQKCKSSPNTSILEKLQLGTGGEPVTDVWKLIPGTDVDVTKQNDQVDKFSKIVKDHDYYSDIIDYWRNWSTCVQDFGTVSLQGHTKLSEVFSTSTKDDDKTNELGYSHLKMIARGVRIRSEHETAEAAMETLDKRCEKDTVLQQSRDLLAFGINTQIHESVDYSNYEELERDIGSFYSRMMQEYQELIEVKRQEIRLNLAVTDDPLVKHVILSNAHLDKAASLVYTGSKPKYEIYNSTMVDLFLNLVHSLVAKDEFKSEGALITNSSSSEVMDSNDMSSRTKPIVSATMLSFTNLLTTDNNIGTDEVHLESIKMSQSYGIFETLFQKGNSPLFNYSEAERSHNRVRSQGIQTLYNNYLSEMDGIRKYSPVDVIQGLESLDSTLFFDEESLKTFWENILEEKSIDPIEIDNAEGMNVEVFTNMVNWIRLLNPALIDHIYKATDEPSYELFSKLTSEWRTSWKELFHNENKGSLFNEVNRKVNLSNFVDFELANTAEQKEIKAMTEVLFQLGIINPSHLAAIPSAMITEFAPLILKGMIDDLAHHIQFAINNEIHTLTVGEPYAKLNGITLLLDQLFESNPLPSSKMARISKDSPWLKSPTKKIKQLKSATQVNKWKWILSSEGFASSYLRIPQIPVSELHKYCWIYDVSPHFKKHYSTLNFAAIEKFPEFGSATLLDKLIDVSSDVHSKVSSREVQEIPQFRLASADLNIYSQPRNLHSGEQNVSLLFRIMLLGNQSDLQTKQSKALYDKNTKSPEWLAEIHSLNQMDYLNNFNPVTFSKNIYLRLKLFSELVADDEIKLDNVLDNAIIRFLGRCTQEYFDKNESTNTESTDDSDGDVLNQDEGSFQTKEYFEQVHNHLQTRWKDVLSDEHTEEISDKIVELKRSCSDLAGLLSRLSSLTFTALRQFEFDSNVLHAGSGVAYDFEGTLDPIRSIGSEYLMVVNSSTDIDESKVRESVNNYFTDYLEVEDHLSTGKVFVQRLDYGPLAHMTLISQKAALVELSYQYQILMSKIEDKRFEIITSPFVHPYSFLRNILWINTFQCEWMESATSSYKKMFEIPTSVIKQVIGKPELIAMAEKTVQTSGDMSGTELSKYDVNLWNDCKILHFPIDATSEHYSKRMRGQLHIPDMLLINYFLAHASENVESLNKYFQDGDAESNKIYPVVNWQKRFVKSGIANKFGNIVPVAEEEDEDLLGIGKDKDSPFWLEALKNWMEYLKPKNTGPTE